jgi:hypothetical protein
MTCTYHTLTKTAATNTPAKKEIALHMPRSIPTPSATNNTPLAVLEIDDHKILLKKKLYTMLISGNPNTSPPNNYATTSIAA